MINGASMLIKPPNPMAATFSRTTKRGYCEDAKHMQEAKLFAIFDLHKRCRVGFAFSFRGMVPAIP